jgi:cell division protein FtsI/penicillin-binding protein 2
MVKTRLILLIFTVFFVLIAVKLFYLQVISPQLSSDYFKYDKIYPERGKIFDRNSAPMALNQTRYLLYVEPKNNKDIKDELDKIDKVLKIGESTLEAKIDIRKDWVAVKSGLTKEQKKHLESFKIEGIGFRPQFQRYYPEGSASAHLLGFVGKNKEGEDVGYFGIEGFYDKDLYGLPGFLKTERDIYGRPILVGTQDKTDPENGRNLVLTVDKSVQSIAKRELVRGLERYKAKEGCVIIADPATMEILALTCLPDFDPDRYFLFSQDDFKNQAITSVYEPGSTFKPLVMAAALNEKKVKPDDFYNEKGAITRSGYRIKTWNDKYEGKISMTRILEKSSNVGMVYVGEKLGKKKLYQYLTDYGFSEPTGIDLQGEFGGILKPANQWYDIDYSTVTFGQGMAVTPMQMIRAFSSLINGGELLRPYIVKKIIYEGREKIVDKKLERRVISEKTSQIMKKMLVSTVEHGEYKWIKPEGYRIGGKTGTAQIAIQGKYDPSKTIASFIGFAPADEPKFVALVILRETKTSPYGSETAAPLFFDIARELLIYYNIAPQQ